MLCRSTLFLFTRNEVTFLLFSVHQTKEQHIDDEHIWMFEMGDTSYLHPSSSLCVKVRSKVVFKKKQYFLHTTCLVFQNMHFFYTDTCMLILNSNIKKGHIVCYVVKLSSPKEHIKYLSVRCALHIFLARYKQW